MRMISVRLDDASEANLEQLCRSLGLSQTDVVKAGLELLQRQHQNPAALAESLGLVAAFASAGNESRTHQGRDHAALLKQKLQQQRADGRV